MQCATGMCGAYDCQRCRPGNREPSGDLVLVRRDGQWLAPDGETTDDVEQAGCWDSTEAPDGDVVPVAEVSRG